MTIAGEEPVLAHSIYLSRAAPAHRVLLPRWLTHLGGLGLFSVAVLDSSIIPLPLPGSTDLLLLWLVAHGGNPWLLAASAVLGSLLGGYTTWRIGKKGGETSLRRYLPRRFLDRIVEWVGHHPVLAVFLPAILPPPVPLSPFILASGALGVTRNRFLAAFGVARALRYSLVAWLAVAYGRRVVRLWSGTLQKWSTPILWVFAGLTVCAVCAGILNLRKARKAERENGGVALASNARRA